MTEYVKFSASERVYGQKGALQVELAALQLLKKVRAFSDLRKEELVLKIALKKKIDELLETFKVMDKVLPHHAFHFKKQEKGEISDEVRGLTLEQEIEGIRMKLDKLQGSFS